MDFSVAGSIEVLQATPGVLRALLSGLSPDWTEATEGPETFSPRAVLGHLIDGEETDWIPRARIILARGSNPVFEPFDRFRYESQNPGTSIPELLDQFTSLRRANLTELRGWNLGAEQLELRGIHPEFGAITLRQMLATWTVHDLGHIAQVARVMAKQYRGAIGPWERYLPVVTDRPSPVS